MSCLNLTFAKKMAQGIFGEKFRGILIDLLKGNIGWGRGRSRGGGVAVFVGFVKSDTPLGLANHLIA